MEDYVYATIEGRREGRATIDLGTPLSLVYLHVRNDRTGSEMVMDPDAAEALANELKKAAAIARRNARVGA